MCEYVHLKLKTLWTWDCGFLYIYLNSNHRSLASIVKPSMFLDTVLVVREFMIIEMKITFCIMFNTLQRLKNILMNGQVIDTLIEKKHYVYL